MSNYVILQVITEALYSLALVTTPIQPHLINFTDTRFLLLDFFLSLPSPSSLHLSGARPELGERKTEKKKKRKSEKKREIGFPFRIGSLEWSLKPQSALALDKEAGFNKYVD